MAIYKSVSGLLAQQLRRQLNIFVPNDNRKSSRRKLKTKMWVYIYIYIYIYILYMYIYIYVTVCEYVYVPLIVMIIMMHFHYPFLLKWFCVVGRRCTFVTMCESTRFVI